MARNVGQNVLRIISIIGAVAILGIVVLTASATLMPGTKVRKLFGASAEELARTDESRVKTRPVSTFAADPVTGGTPASEQQGEPQARLDARVRLRCPPGTSIGSAREWGALDGGTGRAPENLIGTHS